jgi:hypothetical protein
MDISYVAGFFDGEGCLSFEGVRSRPDYGHYRITIGQVTRPVLDAIKEFLESNGIHTSPVHLRQKKKKEYWRPCFALRIGRRDDVAKFCRLVQPHVIVKKETVDNFLTWYEKGVALYGADPNKQWVNPERSKSWRLRKKDSKNRFFLKNEGSAQTQAAVAA